MMITLLGIPTHYGGHVSGPELTPNALRRVGLVEAFNKQNILINDLGNVALPEFLPNHIMPPILNYPSPRVVWDKTNKHLIDNDTLDSFLLVLGGDCSIVVGTTTYLSNKYGEDLHIVFVDAHVDNFKPKNDLRVGAATMGIWLLSNENMFWPKPKQIEYSNFTVIGCHDFDTLPVSVEQISTIPLEQLRKEGIIQSIKNFKNQLPQNKKIFVHFDVDVIREEEMQAAYFPSKDGLTFAECSLLLHELLADKRIIGLEVTEFSPLKDITGNLTLKIANLLTDSISSLLKSY
jgi:arginase family enzyme